MNARRAALVLTAVAVLLVGAFDLAGPNLAYNDDWSMAWTVSHFPRIYPAASALAYPQELWAVLVTFGNHDRRLLRLSTIVFVAAAAFGVERLARRAGAEPLWAAMAGLALAACPVFTTDATAFMTDVPYVGLEVLAVLAALRWREGGSPLPFVALAVAAALQRQVGIAVPAAVTAALVLQRRWTLRDLGWPIAATVLSAAALLAVSAAGLAPPTQQNRLVAASAQSAVFALTAFMFLPGMVGLGAGVLLPGLVAARARPHLGPLALAIAAWELFVFVFGKAVLPGNVFTLVSLNWTYLGGHKPPIYPVPVFAAIELLAVAGAVVLGFKLRAALSKGKPAVLLATVAVFQFAPLLLVHYTVFDRYFLPVIALLLPLAARAASGAGERAAWAGMGVAAALLAVYAVGEQDYGAWQSARDQAARSAYARESPYAVHAGYEANAVYGEVRAYDRDGTILSGLSRPGAPDFSEDGPVDPALRLLIVPADDPRHGISYWSLAPGKVIVVPGDVQR